MERGLAYESAFEAYLRAAALPYFRVDEAHRSIGGAESVKSVDFVVLPPNRPRLVIDVKGRRFPGGTPEHPRRVWENWVTQADIDGLTIWADALGPNAEALLVFAYALTDELRLPESTADLWSHGGQRYLLRGVTVASYRRWMRQRSPRWQTVCLPTDIFRELVQPIGHWLHAQPLISHWDRTQSACESASPE
ncbi:HYExAFE family protein [Tuwongella immobilis]|uniref:Uncharacterized protein n=1 Tax=Tuwongella immobilis TaxID=692036 RepID=A0A6C2YJ35_9BACT|nr:HYExAFE family protein [Tuwongella immobilis]VIP01417.1 Uncharacterized protein OS=Blastopirellula marina DSM 3645 GN=DSM3645_07440 PE=4 SV=1 [Tuwongella immobilis]VTR98343.1 Uncharacterized protein OS=Blastopirellula marina DSM 3645 GN=DSM3645_07440 PE=4 SV=1 [Tuwongella immobilis]